MHPRGTRRRATLALRLLVLSTLLQALTWYVGVHYRQ